MREELRVRPDSDQGRNNFCIGCGCYRDEVGATPIKDVGRRFLKQGWGWGSLLGGQ